MFQRVRVGRVSEEVVKQVQDAIFSGQLEPGDRLPSERELAEQFGLSRMSVRDALRSLESSGLVEIKVGSNGRLRAMREAVEAARRALESGFPISDIRYPPSAIRHRFLKESIWRFP